MAERARGMSDSPVTNEWERKSVGEQETFERDTLDPTLVLGAGATRSPRACSRGSAPTASAASAPSPSPCGSKTS